MTPLKPVKKISDTPKKSSVTKGIMLKKKQITSPIKVKKEVDMVEIENNYLKGQVSALEKIINEEREKLDFEREIQKQEQQVERDLSRETRHKKMFASQ